MMTKKRKTMIQWVDWLYGRATGRSHNFRVVLGYKKKGQRHKTEITMYRCFSMPFLPCPDDFYRAIRKNYGPGVVEHAKAHHGSLGNGHVTLESINYLGRF